jgi:subtilisin-like proprotein convertase family protein
MLLTPLKTFAQRLRTQQPRQDIRRLSRRSTRRLPAPVSQLIASEQLEDRMLLSATLYQSTDVPQAIPDQGTAVSTIQVPDSVTIGDVNVQLDISHPSDQDLDVFLIAPDGTRVELFTDVGGGGDNFVGTILDDEAAGSITDGSAPFTGSFQPEGNLSEFDGKKAAGTWTLEITDDKRRNTGTLKSWSIEVTSAQPVLPSISIDDVQLAEGDSGTTAFVFTVSRTGDLSGTSSVDFATADGIAVAGTDYVSANGTVQFLANETSKTISTQVNGDTTDQDDEEFFVNLSNVTGATIADAQGQGTIFNDDGDVIPNDPLFSDQ